MRPLGSTIRCRSDQLGRPDTGHFEVSALIDEFDVVVIHYSVVVILEHFLEPFFREKLARYKGLKVQFIQDDYRNVELMCSNIRELGINVLFTLYSPEKIDAVYSPQRLPSVTKYSTLAGYVPENLAKASTPTIESRPIDNYGWLYTSDWIRAHRA